VPERESSMPESRQVESITVLPNLRNADPGAWVEHRARRDRRYRVRDPFQVCAGQASINPLRIA
jgi:hypothetical protein